MAFTLPHLSGGVIVSALLLVAQLAATTLMQDGKLLVCFGVPQQCIEASRIVETPAPVPPVEFDAKPILASLLHFADTATTERFLRKQCTVERNDRYWGHAGFTPDHPDTGRMWREKSILFASAVASTWAASRVKNKPLRWLMKGVVYAGAARSGYAAARNIAKCGL